MSNTLTDRIIDQLGDTALYQIRVMYHSGSIILTAFCRHKVVFVEGRSFRPVVYKAREQARNILNERKYLRQRNRTHGR